MWDATTFTKNRTRLERGEVFAKFMARLLNHLDVKPLCRATQKVYWQGPSIGFDTVANASKVL